MRVVLDTAVRDIIIQLEEERLAALMDNPAFASALDSNNEAMIIAMFGYDALSEEIPENIMQIYYAYDAASNTVDIPTNKLPADVQIYGEQGTAAEFKQAAQMGNAQDEADFYSDNDWRVPAVESSIASNAQPVIMGGANAGLLPVQGEDADAFDDAFDSEGTKVAADEPSSEDADLQQLWDSDTGEDAPTDNEDVAAMWNEQADEDVAAMWDEQPDDNANDASVDECTDEFVAEPVAEPAAEPLAEPAPTQRSTEFNFEITDDDEVELFEDESAVHYRRSMQQYIEETRIIEHLSDAEWTDEDAEGIIQRQLATQADIVTRMTMKTGCTVFDEYIEEICATAVPSLLQDTVMYEQLQELIDIDKLVYEMQDEHFVLTKQEITSDDVELARDMLQIAQSNFEDRVQEELQQLLGTDIDDFWDIDEPDEGENNDLPQDADEDEIRKVRREACARLPNMAHDYIVADDETAMSRTADEAEQTAVMWNAGEVEEGTTEQEDELAQLWSDDDDDDDAVADDDIDDGESVDDLWHSFDDAEGANEAVRAARAKRNKDAEHSTAEADDTDDEDEDEDASDEELGTLWDSMFAEEESQPVDNAIMALQDVEQNIESGAVTLPKTKNEAAADCVVALYNKMALFPVLVGNAFSKMKVEREDED